MRMRIDPRAVLAVAAFALLASLAGIALAVWGMPPEQLAPRLWRGYFTVLCRPAEGVPALAAALQGRKGVQAVVSRYTSPASFNSFDGFASVPVAALAERLDAGDPRFDPYLRGLGEFFRTTENGRSREVIYVRSERSAVWLLALLARLPEARGLRLRVLELGPAALLRLCLLCVFAALLVVGQEGWQLRLLTAAAVLPWVPVVTLGSALLLPAALALLPLWPALLGAAVPFFEERLYAGAARRRRRPAAPVSRRAPGSARGPALRLGGCLLAAAAVFIVLHRAGQPLGTLSLAAASGVLLVPLTYALLTLQMLRAEHVPFVPVPVALTPRRRAGGGGRNPGLAPAALAVILLCLPLLYVSQRLQPGGVPAPSAAAGPSGLSWAALQALDRDRRVGALPDLAAYLSHRAYQEGLAFGRPYAFPSPGERLVIPSFARTPDGEEVIRADRVALRYADTWLERTLAGAAESSVARLLVEQGQATRVERERGGERGAGPAAAALAAAALCLCAALVTCLLSPFDPRGLTLPRLCAKRGLALGRRQHIVW